MAAAWYDVLGHWREMKQEKNAQKYKQVTNAFNYITIFTTDFFATIGFLFPWGLFLDGIQFLYQRFGETAVPRRITQQTVKPAVEQVAEANVVVEDALDHSRVAEFMGVLGMITTAWRHIFAMVGAGVGILLSFVLVPVLYLYRDKIKNYIDLDKDYVTIDHDPIDFWNLVFGRLKRDSESELDDHLELLDEKLPLALHYNKNKLLWLAAALVVFAMSYLTFLLSLPYMMIGLMTSVLGFGWLAIAVGVTTAILDVLQITDSWIKHHIDSESRRQSPQQRESVPIANVQSHVDYNVTVSGVYPKVQPINIEPNSGDALRFIRACRHTPAYLAGKLKKHFDSYNTKQRARSPLDTELTRNVFFHVTGVDLRSEEKAEQVQGEGENHSVQVKTRIAL